MSVNYCFDSSAHFFLAAIFFRLQTKESAWRAGMLGQKKKYSDARAPAPHGLLLAAVKFLLLANWREFLV